jgi:hypothetical protein
MNVVDDVRDLRGDAVTLDNLEVKNKWVRMNN